MFSPNSMINLLFANPKDTYYAEGLVQFNDLNQYIWYLLHKHNRCDVAYFIDFDEAEFKVSGFGKEEGFSPYSPGWITLNPANSLRRWIMDRLKDKKHRCTIVCSLKLFCSLYKVDKKDGDKKTEIDKSLANLISLSQDESDRNGFFLLTSSLYVEDSKDYLLDSQVFSKHRVNNKSLCLCEGIADICRDYKNCTYSNIYMTLSRNMKAACVFLNQFTTSSLTALIHHVCLRENISVDPEMAEDMITYLGKLLNGRPFLTGQVLRDFFDEVPPDFKQLYTKLRNPASWEQVKIAYQSVADCDNEYTLPIYYRDATIQKCLALQLSPELEQDECTKKQLSEIKKHLLMVKNKKINETIKDEMNTVAVMYTDFQKNELSAQVQQVLLSVLNQCTVLLYEEEGSEEQNRIVELSKQVLPAYIAAWNDWRKKKDNIEIFSSPVSGAGQTATEQIRAAAAKKLKEKIQKIEDMLEQLKNTAYGKMLLETEPAGECGSVIGFVESLSQKDNMESQSRIDEAAFNASMEELDPAWAGEDYFPTSENLYQMP